MGFSMLLHPTGAGGLGGERQKGMGGQVGQGPHPSGATWEEGSLPAPNTSSALQGTFWERNAGLKEHSPPSLSPPPITQGVCTKRISQPRGTKGGTLEGGTCDNRPAQTQPTLP